MLEDILTSDDILTSIDDNLDYLLEIIPELKCMIGFEHKHPHHHLDVWNHTLCALSYSPNNFEIRLSILLHDIGKPHSYTEGEVRHFENHPIVSAKIAKEILKRLGYNEKFIKKICYLIEYHDTPISDIEIKKYKLLSYKRYIIQYCDTYAHNPDKIEKRVKYLKNVRKKLAI